MIDSLREDDGNGNDVTDQKHEEIIVLHVLHVRHPF